MYQCILLPVILYYPFHCNRPAVNQMYGILDCVFHFCEVAKGSIISNILDNPMRTNHYVSVFMGIYNTLVLHQIDEILPLVRMTLILQ